MKRWVIYLRLSPNVAWKLGQHLAYGTSEDQAKQHAEVIQQKLRRQKGRRRVEVRASSVVL